jgi:hypothetical protein
MFRKLLACLVLLGACSAAVADNEVVTVKDAKNAPSSTLTRTTAPADGYLLTVNVWHNSTYCEGKILWCRVWDDYNEIWVYINLENESYGSYTCTDVGLTITYKLFIPDSSGWGYGLWLGEWNDILVEGELRLASDGYLVTWDDYRVPKP